MAVTNLLRMSQLEDFKIWLEKDGWIVSDGGNGQELYVEKPGRKAIIIYSRDKTGGGEPGYLSVPTHAIGIVRAFLGDFRLQLRTGLCRSEIVAGLQKMEQGCRKRNPAQANLLEAAIMALQPGPRNQRKGA